MRKPCSSLVRPCRPTRLREWRWVLPFLASSMAAPAFAQSTPGPSGSDASAAPVGRPAPKQTDEVNVLDQITVSATRRPELVRDVPLSVTSVSAERLEESGARSLNDYLQSVPGVVLQNSGSLSNTGFIIIRGLTTGIDAHSPTTIYLDEVPLAVGAPFDINLSDLARFEVLKGPQGTLYGSSAMGGIVKYVTREPDTQALSGRVLLGGSQTERGGTNALANAVVNIPLKEGVAAARLAVFGELDGGYVNATGPAGRNDINRGRSGGGRLNLLLTPTRELRINLVAMSQSLRPEGNDRVVYDLATRSPVAGDLVFSNLGVREPRTEKRDLYSSTVEYDLGWAKLLSISAHQDVRDDNVLDFTSLGAALLGATDTYAPSKVRNHQTSQEFRLVSQTPGPIEWLAGLFYSKSDLTTLSDLLADGGFVPGLLQRQSARRDFREYAGYGDVTWNATPALSITGGLRVAHYEQTDTISQDGLLIGGPQPDRSFTAKETPKTYLFATKYRLTTESNLYVRAANGYRPGGVNNNAIDPLTGRPIPGVAPGYGTDRAWTYEAGFKASRPETGTSFEISAFQTNWSDIQQSTTVGTVSFVTNLGRARVRGVEAGGSVRPIRELTLGIALSYLDPVLREDSEGLQAKAGDRLPNSPRFAGAFTSRYEFPLLDRPAYVGLNASWEGERNSGFERSTAVPNYRLPGFAQLDFTSGLSTGRYDVTLYVRNLTDKRGQLGATTGEASIGRTYVNLSRPRTYGLNVAASF